MPAGIDTEIVNIIGLIYDAVIDRAGWQEVIDRLRLYVGAQVAALAAQGFPRGNVIVQAASNIPAEFLAAMGNYGDDVVNMWGGAAYFATLPLEEPRLQTTVTDFGQWEQYRYYTE